MRDKMSVAIFAVFILVICMVILFGEQIMELLVMEMTEQATSLVDQLLQ